MEDSKNRVESLGYFDQKEGVNWKMTRLSEDLADMDLLLKEAPTGNAHIKIGIGGLERDIKSPISGVSAEAAVTDRNLFGSGIQLNASARFSKDERSFLFSLADPWLFDRPLFGKMDLYFRSLGYDEFHHTRPVNERDAGANATFGFVTTFINWGYSMIPLFGLMSVLIAFVIEHRPIAAISGGRDKEKLILPINRFLINYFVQENMYGLLLTLVKIPRIILCTQAEDTRGYSLTQLAVPSFGSCIGFQKFTLDFNWFTPLINEHDLVFHLHSFIGFVNNFRGHLIPYRELFNIGGPASVRGFLFGQIGPQFFINGLAIQLEAEKHSSGMPSYCSLSPPTLI